MPFWPLVFCNICHLKGHATQNILFYKIFMLVTIQFCWNKICLFIDRFLCLLIWLLLDISYQ